MIPRLLFSLLCLMSFFVALPVIAQEYVAAIKIGGAVTTFSGETNASIDPHAGLTGGAAIGYDFGNGFLFQPEILYVRKGASFDGTINGVPARIQRHFAYLEFPLLAVYRFDGRRLDPKVFIGPFLAYKLNAQIEYRAFEDGISFSQEDENVESFDYGGVAGIGTDFFFAGERLSIDARAVFGQTNIFQADPPLKFIGGVLMVGIVF